MKMFIITVEGPRVRRVRRVAHSARQAVERLLETVQRSHQGMHVYDLSGTKIGYVSPQSLTFVSLVERVALPDC